ncbi:hypothetical protein C8F01DRAFT_662786 [Mycena amicta]|nr:hypothetical protein C8F01DRAFT_662786 [Mycena amicta]
MARNLAPSEVYCEQLLYQSRGFPLYVPEAQSTLPAQNRAHGVAIGDVGRVTPDGVFDFFFNIYCPAGDPVNVHGVPDDFQPLPRYQPNDVLSLDNEPGDIVSSHTIRETDEEAEEDHGSEEFPGAEFRFTCVGPEGAVLALPHGSIIKKLEHRETLRSYIGRNAANWYQYVNSPEGRGRQLANGLLYLITGCEKAQSWGIGTYQNVAAGREFELLFRPSSTKDDYRWRRGTPARTKRFIPQATGPLSANQTVFIHGYSISLGERLWSRLFGQVSVQEITTSRKPNSGSSFIPFSSSSTTFSGFFASSPGKTSSNNNTPSVITADLTPKLGILHPSQLLHDYLRQALYRFNFSTEKTIITHDDDWGNLFQNVATDNDTSSQWNSPESSEIFKTLDDLNQLMMSKFKVSQDEGCIFLEASAQPSASDRTVDHGSVASRAPHHGRIIKKSTIGPSSNISFNLSILTQDAHPKAAFTGPGSPVATFETTSRDHWTCHVAREPTPPPATAEAYLGLDVVTLRFGESLTALPVKRGRGRPKGSKNKKTTTSHLTVDESISPPPKKRRGRPSNPVKKTETFLIDNELSGPPSHPDAQSLSDAGPSSQRPLKRKRSQDKGGHQDDSSKKELDSEDEEGDMNGPKPKRPHPKK